MRSLGGETRRSRALSTENLYELASLIRRERDTLLAEWRQEVRQLSVAHNLDVPTLNDHMPDLLEELAWRLLAAISGRPLDFRCRFVVEPAPSPESFRPGLGPPSRAPSCGAWRWL